MADLTKQARAEAEKRMPGRFVELVGDLAYNVQAARMRKAFVEGAVWAATRTRVVTVERLADELCRASAVWSGHPYAGDVPCDQHKYEAEVVLPLLYEPEEGR